MHNGNIETVLLDLEYFRDELTKLYKNNELSSEELLDIMSYINRIIMHITDGNEYEERMVNIMGGKVEETPSQALKRTHSEKIALKLFENGATYEMARNSIPLEEVSDSKLKGLMNLAVQSV